MPISLVYTGQPMTGTAADDFFIAFAGSTGTSNNTVNGNAGDDWVLGDSSDTFIPTASYHNNSIANAFSLEAVSATWTTSENPLFGNPATPHVTAIVEATAGESEFFSVNIGAGQTITVDIDFGSNSSVGIQGDLVVEIQDLLGNILFSSDDSAVSSGGLGSSPRVSGASDSYDPYLTFTPTSAGTYYINVRPFGSGTGSTFTAANTFVMNVSVTGHDTVANPVMGADTIDGGDGADHLFGQGGNDVINGGLGADLIHAGSGLDIVHGDGGNDILYGGDGTEENIHGDAGHDTLYSGGEGHYYGDDGDDLIYAGLTAGVQEVLDGGIGFDTLDTTSWNGVYQIDLATGATNFGESFINFENLITGNGADQVQGNDLANTIRTNGGDDVINGLGGADILGGGAGADTLNGGDGVDTADYSRAAGAVTARLDLNAASNDGDGGTDTFSGIENLTGSDFNDLLIGGAASNTLRGGMGADTLMGMAGNDTLVGGIVAANTLIGGTGNDYYLLQAADSVVENVGEGTDTVDARIAAYNLANNVENLIFGGVGDFAGTGNALANAITGGAGNDNLRGRGGADILNGGAGIDTVDYTLAAAGVTARLDTWTASNDGDGATDSFIAIENLTGSNYSDLLIGNGAVNVLKGGIGNDTLLGFGGDDVLWGGSGGGNNQLQGGTGNDWYVLDAFDTVVELAGEGSDTVEARIGSYTMGANIENLIYTGPGGFVGAGNALNNNITGGAGNDILKGGGGDDIIRGGAGTDELQLRGSAAQYSIVHEGSGIRITDSVAGRDGSTYVESIERVRFLTGNTTQNLDYLVIVPAALASSGKEADAQTIPVAPLTDDDPLVLPGLVSKTPDAGPLVLPNPELAFPGLETPHDLPTWAPSGPWAALAPDTGSPDRLAFDDGF